MRIYICAFIIFYVCGCQPYDPYYQQQSYLHTLPDKSQTNKLYIGMTQEKLYEVLGMPKSKESSYDGYYLWYDLHDPNFKYHPVPLLVSVDKDGKVISFNSGAGGSTQSIDVNVYQR